MRDYSNEPCVQAIKQSEHVTAFERLKSILSTYPEKDRTVENWNYLRENYKMDYDPQVINMLDASGFIVKWLNK
jgi:hypothetical protein